MNDRSPAEQIRAFYGFIADAPLLLQIAFALTVTGLLVFFTGSLIGLMVVVHAIVTEAIPSYIALLADWPIGTMRALVKGGFAATLAGIILLIVFVGWAAATLTRYSETPAHMRTVHENESESESRGEQ